MLEINQTRVSLAVKICCVEKSLVSILKGHNLVRNNRTLKRKNILEVRSVLFCNANLVFFL